MWTWFTCHVIRRHDYGVSCENGAIFLHCHGCGRRSEGWAVAGKALSRSRERGGTRKNIAREAQEASRVLPFSRSVAS